MDRADFYFKVLAAVGGLVAVYFAFLNNRKQFSRELIKEQIKSVKILIEDMESSSMVFTFCRVLESGYFSESGLEGTVFDFAKLKSHPYDGYNIYTNSELIFNNSFLKHCSDVNIPSSIATPLKKLAAWKVSMVSEKKLDEYVVAGSDSPITKKSFSFSEVYFSRVASVSKERENDRFFTVVYSGDFKSFIKDCEQLVKEMKKWLKKYNLAEINSEMFKQ